MEPSDSFLDKSAVIEFVLEEGTPIETTDIESRRVLKSQIFSNGGNAISQDKIQGLLITDKSSGLLSLNRSFLPAFDLWVENQGVVQATVWIDGHSGVELGMTEAGSGQPLSTERIREMIVKLAPNPTLGSKLKDYVIDILEF